MAVNYIMSFAYQLFGGYFKKKRSNYFSLRQELLKTRMNISYDMYLSLAVLISLTMAVIGIGLAILIISTFGAPDITLTRSIFTDVVAGFQQYKNLALKIISVILIAAVFGGGTYLGFMNIPRVINSGRKNQINTMLPYAVHYMSAMSGAGVVPVDIFSSLAKNRIYGEAAVEAAYVVRNVKILGHDLVYAMKNVASTTPSYRFQEFLQGAITIVSSGGNLETYFRLKAEQFVTESKREQSEFLETLGVIAETYVTAFVAGPLFLIVMMAVMATMGGMNMILIYLLIYLVIPGGSLMFVVLVNAISPEV